MGAEVVAGAVIGAIGAFLIPIGEEATMALTMIGTGAGAGGVLTGATLLAQDAQKNAAQMCVLSDLDLSMLTIIIKLGK